MRRLPVVQSSEDTSVRPRWHYLLIGAGFTVTLWLPLAMLALWVAPALLGAMLGAEAVTGSESPGAVLESQRRLGALVSLLPLMLSFFGACLASATLVGRFGGSAGRREAILGNLLGSAVVSVLAWLGSESPWLVHLASLGFLGLCSVLGGLGGAALGKRLRAKAVS